MTTLSTIASARATASAPGTVTQTQLDQYLATAAAARALADSKDVEVRKAINAIQGLVLGTNIDYNTRATFELGAVQTTNETASAQTKVYQESDRWGNIIKVSDARNPVDQHL